MVKKEISGMVLGQCVWYIPTCVDVYVNLFIIFLDRYVELSVYPLSMKN